MLQPTGSQRVGHDRATKLNWALRPTPFSPLPWVCIVGCSIVIFFVPICYMFVLHFVVVVVLPLNLNFLRPRAGS